MIQTEVVNAFATHPGKRSEAKEQLNEDFAHAWEKNSVYFQVLADGNGRVEGLNPAAFVINEVHRFVDTYSDPDMSFKETRRMIKAAIYSANRILLAYKRASSEKGISDSFASLDLTAICTDGRLISAHIGDSRTYLLRDNKIHLITKDQTVAQCMCDEGKISKEQIFTHSDRDVLTSVLGTDNPQIDIREGKLKAGDIILLLTDGAHKVLSPEQISNIVFSAGNCYDTCNGIIEGANLLGGPDNISVCVSYIPN